MIDLDSYQGTVQAQWFREIMLDFYMECLESKCTYLVGMHIVLAW